jgi:hypothetical protein
MFAIKHPRSLIRIAAPSLKQAGDIVADALESITQDAPKGLVVRSKSTFRWNILTSTIRLGVLEKAHVDTLRGARADLIICEEGGFVNSDDYQYAVRSVLSPQLIHSNGHIMHITTPSEDSEHYIHTEVKPRCEMAGTYFKYTIHTNPRLNEEQIQATARLLGGINSTAWKREALAEIVRDDNYVCIPEFDEAIHVESFALPKHSYYLTAVDFGGVRDKTACLLLTWDFLNARFLVFEERIYPANTATLDIVIGLGEMEFMFDIKDRIVDAPGQLLVDLRNKHGYEALLPRKDNADAALNNVRLLFCENKILIHPQCKFLIATLKGAAFNKHRTDFARTESLGHMDALAALMYGVRMFDKTQNPYPKEQRNLKEIFYTFPESQEDDLDMLANGIFGR